MLFMLVAVMNIGYVCVPVRQRRVPVRMRMGLSRRLGRKVLVLVMVIMNVNVLVFGDFVGMNVPMLRTKKHDDASGHRSKCHEINDPRTFAENRNGSDRAHERCSRKEGGFSCCADLAQGVGVEKDAHAVTEDAQDQRPDNDGSSRESLP